MRELTNRHNLLPPITAAVDRYSAKYDKGGAKISATQLGEPPRIIALKNRHGEEIQEDYADRLYVLDGHIVHEILEAEAKGGEWTMTPPMVEKRLHAQINGWAVSGQVDHYDPATGILSDYKRVSIAQRKRGAKEEWVWQLNALAHLLRANEFKVTKLQAIRWYRDWSLSAKSREFDYPDCAIETIEIPMWAPEEAEAWIASRVEIHKLAEMVADDAELPPCTEKERWNPGTTFAVMSPGAAKAARVLPSEAEAAQWIGRNPGKNFQIVTRPGVNRRCQLYCAVAPWCDIGRRERQDNRITEEVKVAQ